MDEYKGHAIVGGELKYASVSSVKLYDPNTKGGCPRRWLWKYGFGLKEVDSEHVIEAKNAGIALDTEVKRYLRTGDKTLSALALKGLHVLELPGPDLGLDVKIHAVQYWRPNERGEICLFKPLPPGQRYPNDVRVVIRSELTAAGVPFVGELDVVHARGHYRDDDGTFHNDPPDTVEVGDLKYKSNAKDRNGNSNYLLPTDLVRDIQMAGYGEWVARTRPSTRNVRLSHLYFPKKPTGALPTKVTRLHVIDDCRRTWEYVDGVVREMKDVAKETDIERVPGNVASCDAYAGCPRREYCTWYRRSSLDNLYGKIADDHVQEKTMGLLASNPQMMQQPMQQQLAQEEQQMRAQVAQQQQQMPSAAPQATLQQYLEVTTRLGGYGFGMPALGGNAAQAYAQAGGQAVAPGFVYQGIVAPPGAKRSLHTVQLNEPAHVFQLESELAAERAAMQPQQYAPSATNGQTLQQASGGMYAPVQMPANTPPVTQAIATQYNQNIANPALPPQQMQQAPISFLPPGAPESIPALAMQRPPEPQGYQATAYEAMQQQSTQMAATAATEPPKKGRPKKAKDVAPEPVVAATTAQTAPQNAIPPIATPGTPVAPAATSDCSVERGAISCSGCVLVNARFADRNTKSLAGYVDYINGELAKRYSVTEDGKPGIQDVRCTPKGSPLAFGGWKGAVREVVKADPPADDLYHFDTFMDELNEAVADALRSVAEAKGWLYIRGVR